MKLETTVQPTVEPITVEDARLHLRVDSAEDDGLIASYIVAARQMVETWTMRGLVSATRKLYIDGFPAFAVELPYAPLTSVTSVQYYDDGGTLQTLATSYYTVDTVSEPGRVHLAYQQTWPSTRAIPSSVVITYVSGYAVTGDHAATPVALKHAIRLLVSHWYENREPVNIGNIVNPLPMAVESLCTAYRLKALA